MPDAMQNANIVILSGAGLSAASGVPTFRDANGLWEGHRIEDVATPDAWFRDRELVRIFYDQRRIACASVLPNPGHSALSRLQHAMSDKRVTLVTQNIDGLLQKASAIDAIEMHGSLWRLRCENDATHPRVGVYGAQSRTAKCSVCRGWMRPDVIWFGEIPEYMDRIQEAVSSCSVFVSVGTSGVVYPAAGLVQVAKAHGAHCIEVNPKPSGGGFDEVIAAPSEEALPKLIGQWLNED